MAFRGSGLCGHALRPAAFLRVLSLHCGCHHLLALVAALCVTVTGRFLSRAACWGGASVADSLLPGHPRDTLLHQQPTPTQSQCCL